jgi:hypothetical protein
LWWGRWGVLIGVLNDASMDVLTGILMESLVEIDVIAELGE